MLIPFESLCFTDQSEEGSSAGGIVGGIIAVLVAVAVTVGIVVSCTVLGFDSCQGISYPTAVVITGRSNRVVLLCFYIACFCYLSNYSMLFTYVYTPNLHF